MTEQEKQSTESRKTDADTLRELADLLESSKVTARPMLMNINQSFTTVAESSNGGSVVQLDRTVSIEIETREFIKNK